MKNNSPEQLVGSSDLTTNMTITSNGTTRHSQAIQGMHGSASNVFSVPNLTSELQFNPGSIQIGELKMTYCEFKLCMTHLLELTKSEKPEEFI